MFPVNKVMNNIAPLISELKKLNLPINYNDMSLSSKNLSMSDCPSKTLGLNSVLDFINSIGGYTSFLNRCV